MHLRLSIVVMMKQSTNMITGNVIYVKMEKNLHFVLITVFVEYGRCIMKENLSRYQIQIYFQGYRYCTHTYVITLELGYHYLT